MKVTKCINGHYYDADKYSLCPHCGALAEGEKAFEPTRSEKGQPRKAEATRRDGRPEADVRVMPKTAGDKTFGVFSDDAPIQQPEKQNNRPQKASNDMKFCVNCGKENPVRAKFCKYCGKVMEDEVPPVKDRVCAYCGKTNPHDGEFCVFCGKKLEGKKPAARADRQAAPAQAQPKSAGRKRADVNNKDVTWTLPVDGSLVQPSAKAGPADETVAVKHKALEHITEKRDSSKSSEAPASENVIKTAETSGEKAYKAPDSTPVSETVSAEELNHAPEPKADAQETESLQDAVRSAIAGSGGKTVGVFRSKSEDSQNDAEPVVGWLVCIEGCHFGESFSIFAGRNSIGRGVSNRIVLPKDERVSREKHVWITYEPKRRSFFVQPGDSSGLAYLNSEPIMETRKLAEKDKLEIGGGIYMLVPLCNEDFSWEEYLK